ncbi:MAG: EAL domain-containing protein [Pseudomonadota bacterium]
MGGDQSRGDEDHRFLAGVIEAMEAATWEWDIPRDRVRINERWAGLLGYVPDDLQPVTVERFRGLIHPDDIAVVEEAIAAHFRGDLATYDCEIRMRHRQGHWVWLQTRGRVLTWGEDGEPSRMFGVHLPIGTRKRHEEYLRRSQELLSITGAVAGVGGYELNLLTNQLTWTDQTKRIHGVGLDYTPSVETAIDFYAPEARATISAAVERALETGEGWDLELPLIRADGERIWVRAQATTEARDGEVIRVYGAFQDVTERRQLTQALAENNDLLNVTLESIGDAVITTDPSGQVTWMNPVAERLTGTTVGEMVGRSVYEVCYLVDEKAREPVADLVMPCIAGRKVMTLERDAILLSRDGSEYAVESKAAPIVNGDGAVLGAVMVLYDVTERRRLDSEMRYRARHDSLTGLLNRSELELTLEAVHENARSAGSQHALLFIDLDQFKIVNDTCGHSVGDELLVRVVGLFTKGVRASDTVARLGGDEFAIILHDCPPEEAERLANAICQRVREFRFDCGEHRFRVSVSIGLVAIHGEWSHPAAIMQAADTACYAAKDAGRDRVRRYHDSDTEIRSQQTRTRWALRIEESLERDRFVLHGQRIVRLGANDPVDRIELLIRMREDDGELIMPGAFMPAAERFRLMMRIDQWVLGEALALLSAQASDATTELYVNLSGQSLGDRDFHDNAMAALGAVPLSVRQRLILEVTETAVIANLCDARGFLESVRQAGVRVALDDFGAGMSSYGYLRSLSFDYLKIDGQLVASMLDDPLSLAVVRSFVDIASVLDLQVVAEHVQNDEIVAELTRLGVDMAQGFHLHRPEPIAGLLAAPPAAERSSGVA